MERPRNAPALASGIDMAIRAARQATHARHELRARSSAVPAEAVPNARAAVAPVDVAERSVFSAGGTTYRWTEVLEAAVARGDWAVLESQTIAGLACARRQAVSGEPFDRAALDDSVRQFRTSRGLLAGDEMRAWLARWAMAVSDVREHLIRAHLRERWARELDETIREYPVTKDEVVRSLWPEAVCSGLPQRSANALAADVAVTLESGDGADRSRGMEHDEAAIQREITSNRLEWHRIAGESLQLRSLDVAREVALMIREDGLALSDVARQSGGELRRFQVYLSEVPDDEAVAYLGAQEGDVIGPRARDGQFVVDWIREKRPPNPADPEVRRKAIAQLTARAVERATSLHVTWHEHL